MRIFDTTCLVLESSCNASSSSKQAARDLSHARETPLRAVGVVEADGDASTESG